MSKKILGKGSLTITTIDDALKAYSSAPSLVISCNAEQTQFELANAKTMILLTVGNQQLPANFYRLELVTPIINTDQVEGIVSLEDGNIVAITELTSKRPEGTPSTTLILGKIKVKVTLTDAGKAAYPSNAEYEEVIEIPWNTLQSGSSGYTVKLSRGNNCIIYSDSIDAEVPQVQLDTLVNQITVTKIDYTLDPVLSLSELTDKKFFVEVVDPVNCTVRVVAGNTIIIDKITNGDDLTDKNAVAQYTVNVYCENQNIKYPETVVITKILPKEDLYIAGDQAFVYGNNFIGEATPSLIKLTATSKWSSSNYDWAYSVAGSESWIDITDESRFDPSDPTHRTLFVTPTGSEWSSSNISAPKIVNVTYRVTANGTSDYKTVFKVSGGSDSYTNYLTNANAIVACEVDGTLSNPSQIITTNVRIFRGSTELTYWAPDPSNPDDTVSNHIDRFTITPSDQFDITDQGTIVVPSNTFKSKDVTEITINFVCYGGYVGALKLIINKAYKGLTGEQGEHALAIDLTNDTFVIHCDNTGKPLEGALVDNISICNIYKGDANISANNLANDAGKVCVYQVVVNGASIRSEENPEGDIELVEYEGCPNRKVVIYNISGDTASITWQVKVTNELTGHVSNMTKAMTVSKVLDGQVGEIASVNYLNATTAFIAQSSNSKGGLVLTPAAYTINSIKSGNDKATDDLPISIEASDKDGNKIANIIPINGESVLYNGNISVVIGDTKTHENVKLVAVTRPNKYVHILAGDYTNITDNFDLAFPQVVTNTDSFELTVDGITGKITAPEAFAGYSLYSARTRTGDIYFESGITGPNSVQVSNTYYREDYAYQTLKLWSSRVILNPKVLDEEQITLLHKDWTDVNVRITPSNIGIPSSAGGIPIDYAGCEATISVTTKDLDITNQCEIQAIGNDADVSTGFCGVVEGNGTFIVKYKVTHVPANKQSGNESGITITYGGVTQRYYIPWHLEKQGLSGSSTAFAGQWNGNRTYKVRSALRTVVFVYSDESKKHKTYYWTRELDATQADIEIPLNVDPGSPAGEAYWDLFDGEYQSIATGFLFAEDSYITGLTSAKVYIGDEFVVDKNGNWVYPRIPVYNEDGTPKLDETGQPVTELGKDPIQSLKGWVLDKDVIRSRGTVPMVSSDGKSMVTYMAHYDPTADNPFLVNGVNRQPATILYSDGGLITNKGKIGAWTLNEEALFTSVAFKTGFRKVIGMNVSTVWKLNTTGVQSSPNASQLTDEYPLPEGSGESLLSTITEGDGTDTETSPQAGDEESESTTEYDPATERVNWTPSNATKGTRYAVFAQSPNYLRREDDGKFCQIIDVALHYTDEHNFGFNASLYDDQKNREVKEFFFLGSKSYRNQTTGLEEIYEGGRIAGWMFEDQMIHKDWNTLYLSQSGGWAATEGSSVILNIPNQRVAMFAGSLNSGYSSGLEIFGGNMYLGKLDSDDLIRPDFMTLPTGQVVWDHPTEVDEEGNPKKMRFDRSMLKPEYLMRFGYDTTCLVKKWDPNGGNGSGEWIETPEYVYDEDGNIVVDAAGKQVTVGSPIFRIARYEFENEKLEEVDPSSGFKVKSTGKYYDIFKVDKAGPVLAGWSITREALYNRGIWKQTSFDGSRSLHGAYEYMMVSGADKGLPLLRIQGSKSNTEIPLDPATGLPKVDEEGMYVPEIETGREIFTASVATGIEQYSVVDPDDDKKTITDRHVYFRLTNMSKRIMSIDHSGNRIAGWMFDDIKLYNYDQTTNRVEIKKDGSIKNWIVKGYQDGSGVVRDVVGWGLNSDGSAEFAGGGVIMTYDKLTRKSYVTFGNNSITNLPDEFTVDNTEFTIWYNKTVMRPADDKTGKTAGEKLIKLQGVDKSTNMLKNATLIYQNEKTNDAKLGTTNNKAGYNENKSNPCIYAPSDDLRSTNGEVTLLWFYDKPTTAIKTVYNDDGSVTKTLVPATEGEILLQYYIDEDAFDPALKPKQQIVNKMIKWKANITDSMVYMTISKQHYWINEPTAADAYYPEVALMIGKDMITDDNVLVSFENLKRIKSVTAIRLENKAYQIRPVPDDNLSTMVNTDYASFDVVMTYNGFKYTRTVRFDVYNDPVALRISKDTFYLPVDDSYNPLVNISDKLKAKSIVSSEWALGNKEYESLDGIKLDLVGADLTMEEFLFKINAADNPGLTKKSYEVYVKAPYIGISGKPTEGKSFVHKSLIQIIPVKVSCPALDSYIKSDWINNWTDGVTRIDGDAVMSPKIFAGSSLANGEINGVAIGTYNLNIGGTVTPINGVSGIFGNKEYFRLEANKSQIAGWNFRESALFKDQFFLKSNAYMAAMGCKTTAVTESDVTSDAGLGIRNYTMGSTPVKQLPEATLVKHDVMKTVCTDPIDESEEQTCTQVVAYSYNTVEMANLTEVEKYHWYFSKDIISLGKGSIIYLPGDAETEGQVILRNVKLKWSSIQDAKESVEEIASADYPDWVKVWNGATTEVSANYIAAPNAIVGFKREVNASSGTMKVVFSGMKLGQILPDAATATMRYGIQGVWDDQETFFLNATNSDTVFSHIAGWKFYRGFLNSGRIVISSDNSFIGCFNTDEGVAAWVANTETIPRPVGDDAQYNWFIKNDGKFRFGNGALTYDGTTIQFSDSYREAWTSQWNNSTQISANAILSPRGVFGVYSDAKFSGVVMGITGVEITDGSNTFNAAVDRGIRGYYDNNIIFQLDASGRSIGGFSFDESCLWTGTKATNGGTYSEGITLRADSMSIHTPYCYIDQTGLNAIGGKIGSWSIVRTDNYSGTYKLTTSNGIFEFINQSDYDKTTKYQIGYSYDSYYFGLSNDSASIYSLISLKINDYPESYGSSSSIAGLVISNDDKAYRAVTGYEKSSDYAYWDNGRRLSLVTSKGDNLLGGSTYINELTSGSKRTAILTMVQFPTNLDGNAWPIWVQQGVEKSIVYAGNNGQYDYYYAPGNGYAYDRTPYINACYFAGDMCKYDLLIVDTGATHKYMDRVKPGDVGVDRINWNSYFIVLPYFRYTYRKGSDGTYVRTLQYYNSLGDSNKYGDGELISHDKLLNNSNWKNVTSNIYGSNDSIHIETIGTGKEIQIFNNTLDDLYIMTGTINNFGTGMSSVNSNYPNDSFDYNIVTLNPGKCTKFTLLGGYPRLKISKEYTKYTYMGTESVSPPSHSGFSDQLFYWTRSTSITDTVL